MCVCYCVCVRVWKSPTSLPTWLPLELKCSLHVWVCVRVCVWRAEKCQHTLQSATYFARFAWNIFSTRVGRGWGGSTAAREIVLATVYRLSLFVLWFKNCTYCTYLCIPSFSYPTWCLTTVAINSWAGTESGTCHLLVCLMRLHGVIACALLLLLVACLLLFLLADKVLPINPETRTTWKFECDSVLWLPPAATAAAAAWNHLTATSGLFKIERPQVSPTFWQCWKLKWFSCSYFV